MISHSVKREEVLYLSSIKIVSLLIEIWIDLNHHHAAIEYFYLMAKHHILDN